MLLNLKAMVVVLVIALAVFAIAKPVCLQFMLKDDFERRRNVWLALTLAAFLSPSFWLFALVAVLVLVWAARRDANPVALYLLMMHVIPPIGMEIPMVGINQLFDLTSFRILSLSILVPAILRSMQSTSKSDIRTPALMNALILGYIVLQLALYMPYESNTHTMRRAFLFSLDVLALYFVVSRTCTSRHAIVEAMASFCLVCAVMAPVALFEMLQGWLLYQGLGLEWGNPIDFTYLMRGGILRAEVSAGHSIPLGYMMAIAFGFWLYLRSRVQSKVLSYAVILGLWLGMLAAYSRAPWVVAAAIFFVYSALGPKALARLAKASAIAVLGVGLVLVSPAGERVIDNLPFVGSVGADSVTYREQLAEKSWQLIRENPFFGNPHYMLYLESLRQGQGIIDLMNTYASAAMAYGIVGLALFIGFFVVGLLKTYRLVRSSANDDPDLSLLGANLVASMVGTLVMMATGSFGNVLEKMFYILAGLAAAYVQFGHLKERGPDQ